jgi:hypothetical protein
MSACILPSEYQEAFLSARTRNGKLATDLHIRDSEGKAGKRYAVHCGSDVGPLAPAAEKERDPFLLSISMFIPGSRNFSVFLSPSAGIEFCTSQSELADSLSLRRIVLDKL